LYADETHQSIKRTFVSPYNPTLRHQFCGFCGTNLSRYVEDAEDNAIHITLGSLFPEDLEALEKAGLLQLEEENEEEETAGNDGAMDVSMSRFAPVTGTQHRGAPWYESIVQDTALGRIQKQKGSYSSGDGTYEYEWEVTEWVEGDGDDNEQGDITPGKRKRVEIEEAEDDEMRA
jgi:hypothetical protein